MHASQEVANDGARLIAAGEDRKCSGRDHEAKQDVAAEPNAQT
jgi:hypothetical protein